MNDSPSRNDAPILVEAYYRYGYKGRSMIAIRAPFSMSAEGDQLIGRRIAVDANQYAVRAISRQISGPIQKGEPIGVEIEAALPEPTFG